MKRVLLFTAALCLVAGASFAQKNAVKEAEAIVKGQKPDFTEARNLIKGALENEETKADAQTWYIAGFVEDQEFSQEKTKQVLGQKPDEAKMYTALYGVLPYFQKSLEFDKQPNDKGKVKPRFTKNITSILSVDHVYYINGGAYYFDAKDYQKAYDFFQQYLAISSMPEFEGTPTAAKDSNYMTVQFYAAVAATQLNNPKLAVEALNRAKGFSYRQNDIYQYLCYEYEQEKDSVSLEATLKEGMQKFPEESYYLLSLINNYIYSGRNQEAIQYLNTAISKDAQNAQLYDVMGRVYETGIKDNANAEKYYKQALQVKPDYIESMGNLGRVYYNQGVNKQSDANNIQDQAKYQVELAKAKEFFKQALPLFEKAHQAKPEEREYMTALRGIYYNLNMGDKLKAIEDEMNK